MKQRQRRHRLSTRRLFRPWSSSRFAMEQFFEEINRAKLTLQPRLDALAEELLNNLHQPKDTIVAWEVLDLVPHNMRLSKYEFDGVKVIGIDLQHIPLQKDPNEQ